MKKLFSSEIFKNDIFQLGLIVNFILNAGIWLLVYLRAKPSAEPMALQYNIYFGVIYIGEWYKLYIMPAVGAFIFVLNYLFSIFIYNREKAAAYFLVIGSIGIQALLLLAVQLITTYI